ncbi:unnamed protein product [Trichogramma brassicae]|uniref:Uncharacterized protein n=1 Tax=Trichogramma brassicae TaxID=86971 RepID=A0A6H5IPL3_9HYME|nr:unnamed protein product [Trichogramma brassicae]
MDDCGVGSRSAATTNTALVEEQRIFENLKLHKEVLNGVKQQPWPLGRKLKLVRQAKVYVRKHEGALQERLAQSRSTRDAIARASIIIAKMMENNRERSYIPFLATMDILPRFGGEFDSIPVEEWLERADNDAKTYEWSSKELFVACQRALTNSALRFYNSNVKLDSWEKLKAALIEKFGRSEGTISAPSSAESSKTTSAANSTKLSETTTKHSSTINGETILGSSLTAIRKNVPNNTPSSTEEPVFAYVGGFTLVEDANFNSKSKESKKEEPVYYATLLFLENESAMKNALNFKIAGLAGKARFSNAAEINIMRRDFWQKIQRKLRISADPPCCFVQDGCGKKHQPDGRVKLLTRINGHAYHLDYVIMDLLGVMPEEIMLGIPLLHLAHVRWSADKIHLTPMESNRQ